MSFEINNIAVVILAAGLGTRMKSDKAKVLHAVLGRPMILYVVEVAQQIADDNVIVVVGHQADKVREVVSKCASAKFAFQAQQLGTGHAVLCALARIPAHCEHVVILCGDAPLITAKTIKQFLGDHLRRQRELSVLAVDIDNPTGYGRILTDTNNRFIGIVEEADATDAQKKIRVINSGIYCVEREFLAESLHKINTDNAQGELYLTDIIAVGSRDKKKVGVLIAGEEAEFYGINSRQDLIAVENLMQDRRGNKS